MPYREPPSATHRSRPGHGWRRTALLSLVVAQAVGLLAFFLLRDPTHRTLVLVASPLAAALVVAACTWLSPPARPLAWWALAFGQACSALGWSAWYLSPYGETVAGDAAFLLGYATSAAALLGLVGLRALPDVVATLDAAMITVGLGVLGWVLVVAPAAAAPGTTTPAEDGRDRLPARGRAARGGHGAAGFGRAGGALLAAAHLGCGDRRR